MILSGCFTGTNVGGPVCLPITFQSLFKMNHFDSLLTAELRRPYCIMPQETKIHEKSFSYSSSVLSTSCHVCKTLLSFIYLWRVGLKESRSRLLFVKAVFMSLSFCALDLLAPEVVHRTERAALHHPHTLHRAHLFLRLLAQPPLHQQRPVLRLLRLHP